MWQAIRCSEIFQKINVSQKYTDLLLDSRSWNLHNFASVVRKHISVKLKLNFPPCRCCLPFWIFLIFSIFIITHFNHHFAVVISVTILQILYEECYKYCMKNTPARWCRCIHRPKWKKDWWTNCLMFATNTNEQSALRRLMSRYSTPPEIALNTTPLETDNKFSCLGSTVTDSLPLDEGINSQYRKGSKRLREPCGHGRSGNLQDRGTYKQDQDLDNYL